MMIVSDPTDAALALPSTYGVDDFPIILDDRTFDATGVPADGAAPDAALIGKRGAAIIVNGITDALLKVPQRLCTAAHRQCGSSSRLSAVHG